MKINVFLCLEQYQLVDLGFLTDIITKDFTLYSLLTQYFYVIQGYYLGILIFVLLPMHD